MFNYSRSLTGGNPHHLGASLILQRCIFSVGHVKSSGILPDSEIAFIVADWKYGERCIECSKFIAQMSGKN